MPLISDLALTISPYSALYKTLVPDANIAVNESTIQGRNAIILDFDQNDGLYTRDLGAVFSWPTVVVTNNIPLHLQTIKQTVLDVYQPSIIPEDDDIYARLSYHFLFSSLGLVGWGHLREMNLAHISTTDLTVVLTFDQWPTITLTVPNSGGAQVKTKVTIPANKFKLIDCYVSSSSPFKMFGSDCEAKIGQWGRSEGYAVLKPLAT